jgi:hypothetical protein
MRKFLIAAVGLASLGGSVVTGPAAAADIDMTPGEVKAYCEKKGGNYLEDGQGSSSCQIGTGKGAVVIGCGSGGRCTINNTMVFSSKPATHGPVGQAPNTTLGNGGRISAGAGISDNTMLGNGGRISAGAGISGNGTPTGIKPPANSAGTTVGANGGGPNGRPALQRQ